MKPQNKKLGRPKSDNPKNRKITIKLTTAEFEEISTIAKEQGLNKSEAILKGVRLLTHL